MKLLIISNLVKFLSCPLITFQRSTMTVSYFCYKSRTPGTSQSGRTLVSPFFFPWLYSPFLDLGRLTYRRFLELFRHVVGLLGRVISPSQGLYLHRTKQHKKDADKHPCLKRDSNPRSQQPIGQDPRLRPHGHCDQQVSP
jgi:hypothetical protein